MNKDRHLVSIETEPDKKTEKAALKLIARAEQCTAGLARKLEKRGYDIVGIGAVISRLLELGLVNDRRYAELWIKSRLRLTRSPRRLLAALCGRGIDRGTAEAALNSVLDEEAELPLLARFVKKYAKKANRAGGEENSASLKYLLKSEGFSPQAVQRFFEEER